MYRNDYKNTLYVVNNGEFQELNSPCSTEIALNNGPETIQHFSPIFKEKSLSSICGNATILHQPFSTAINPGGNNLS